MKHSTLSMVLLSALTILLSCAQANAASGDNTAHRQSSGATAPPAPEASLEATSPTSDSGLAAEDASRANEQQLLGLPRVPKDSNPGASGDGDTPSATSATHRSTLTRLASTANRAEVLPAPFPTSIYSNAANRAVYKAPW